MGCTVSRDGDEAVWHDAGTPQAEEKRAAGQRASRRRLGTEEALPRQLFQSGTAGAPRATSLDKKLLELGMDHVVKFHVDAASVGPTAAQPQVQPKRLPPAAPVAAHVAASAVAPTAQAPTANLLDNAGASLPSINAKKTATKLPASVVGIAERLSSQRGQVGPVQPSGASARPRIPQQVSSVSSISSVSSGSKGEDISKKTTSSRKLVPGIAPRGPIDSRSGLGPESSGACPFSPRSATSDVSAANQRSAAAMRASVDVLLRGAHGEIPVGPSRPFSTGSDKPKRRPVVRRKAGSGSIARSTSGSSTCSDTSSDSSTCLRTHSAGSNAVGDEDGTSASTLPSIRPLGASEVQAKLQGVDTHSIPSRVSDRVSVEADKENIGAGEHSQISKAQQNRRKYPTADVRAFVKAARLPSTIVPRLLELLAGQDVAHLPVSLPTLPSALPLVWRSCGAAAVHSLSHRLCLPACTDRRPSLDSCQCSHRHTTVTGLWRSSGWTKGRWSSSFSGPPGRTRCSWTSSYVSSPHAITMSL